jgi:uncharacterized protein (DUF849 family)
MIVRLKACLNGDREVSEHPAIPVTPDGIAAAAAAAVAAGADAVHVHPRDGDGLESLSGADIGAAVSAVRRACPGVPVGVSTGLWMANGDLARRLDLVAGWASLDDVSRPDFASVNLSEPGSAELAKTVVEAGVGVEAGVWSVTDAERLAELSAVPWVRVLVELGLAPTREAATDADVIAEADRILAAVAATGVPAPVLLHGEQSSCWPVLRHAGRLRLATRIGLEDTLTGPSGEPVADNADLVRLARAQYAGG